MTQVGERVRFVCRVAGLRVGDEVLTPSRRWETVTGLDGGEAYSRSTRVTTDATGVQCPWVWVNRHPVHVRRRMDLPVQGREVA